MPDITLPDAATMMTRLRSVIDEPHIVKNLYPHLVAEAGEVKTRAGVEVMVLLAIEDYTATMPAAVKRALMVACPDFVRVLCDA